MPTTRAALEVGRLRSYVISKTCAVPECGKSPDAGLPYCHDHFIIKQRYGVAWAKPLSQNARRVYVRAVRTYLVKQLRRGNITILSAVRELEGYLERHCYLETLRPSDLGRRGITGERKCRSILRAIYERFGKDSELAALAILSAASGAILATKVEPNVERHPHFARACVSSALWSMVRIPTVHNSVTSYKPHRPILAGRRLHESVQKTIIDKYVKWILSAQASKEILRIVLTHKFGRLDWWAWARNQRNNINNSRKV